MSRGGLSFPNLVIFLWCPQSTETKRNPALGGKCDLQVASLRGRKHNTEVEVWCWEVNRLTTSVTDTPCCQAWFRGATMTWSPWLRTASTPVRLAHSNKHIKQDGFRVIGATKRRKQGHRLGFPDDSDGKESACNEGDPGSIPGLGRSPWRGRWKPTPGFLLGESHRQRSLGDYSPWGHKGA